MAVKPHTDHRATPGPGGPRLSDVGCRFDTASVESFVSLAKEESRTHLGTRWATQSEAWRWGSLWVRRNHQSALRIWLRPWPVDRPRSWLSQVNAPIDEEALRNVRQSTARGVPLGQKTWKIRIAHRLGLDITLRPRGRPRKSAEKES